MAPNSGSSATTFPVPSETFEKVRSEHRLIGRLFCDPAFPADESSLYYSRRPPCTIVWMRPPEIVSSLFRTDVLGIAPRKMHFPEFIADGNIRLGDLRQGELGDCWVVAALASMVTQPHLAMRSIPQGQSFRSEWYAGCFCFRFWQFGAWEEVIIDDRLPVRPGGRPLFVHSSRHTEFWPALLEKAYAKLSGSYEALNVSLIGDAMDDIIGGLTESYCLAPGEDQGMRPPPDIDDILIKAFDRRSLITARIKARQAFGLTDCRKLRLTDVTGTRLVRLVRLSNLWASARVGWVGAWSEGSSEWLSLPAEDRIKVGLVKGDGEFWMSMEDFLANFDYLDICHVLESPNDPLGPKSIAGRVTVNSNHQHHLSNTADPTAASPSITFNVHRFFGQWIRGVTAGGRPFMRASHWANPQYVVHMPTPDAGDPEGFAALVVALLQSDLRPLRHRAPRLLSIGFVLYRLPPGASPPMTRHFFETTSHIASVDFFYDSREVVKRFRLVPGVYLLIPCTYSADQPGEFLLRVLFEQPDRTMEYDLSEPDPEFEVILPRVRRLFYEAAGESMAVDAFQLDSILGELLKEDHRFPYAMLSIDACRALIAMRNENYSGKLKVSDFQQLWSLLRCWSRMFASFDPQRTGFVTCLDFRILVEQAGFYLPYAILARLVHRFADAQWRLSYSTFNQIMALLTKAIGELDARNFFQCSKHSRVASLNEAVQCWHILTVKWQSSCV
ncbi:unnamed protein product [Mesocestoides corti]|uniref:Calpain catalytic domain-containing protein n=1 Tax=Mesocestoides corti TaxID=53468 RepID=A0A158QSL6_MESCO|nr:unnamed protein product [Mesocestoides corti]